VIDVQTPIGNRAERTYILSVCFDDWLGIPHRLMQGARDDVCIRLADEPGSLRLPDGFFAQLTRAPDTWLQEASLPALLPSGELAQWDARSLAPDILLTDPLVPILFGDAEPGLGPGGIPTVRRAAAKHGGLDDGQSGAMRNASYRDHRIDLPLDVFGSAFFMLSRYEEAALPERDDHDRFPATASLAYRAGFLDRPIIDEYVEILWAAMCQLWPGLRRKPRDARTVVSCDVDSPFAFSGKLGLLTTRVAGDLLKRRSPRRACRNALGEWQARRGDHAQDPHRRGLELIMSVNERAGRPAAFYFIPENTDTRLDNRVSLDDPRMRALLREIYARGHEIGIHPGYNTYRHPAAMRGSVATLRHVLTEEGIIQPRLGGRQHYLRWQTPTTARLWDENGLDYDSTLSFADRPGFRCGTCREYPLYDLAARRPLRLRERPLILMECSVIASRYMGMGYSDEALALMKRYRDICHRFGGSFTLLWHNSHFNCEADRRFYQELIG
jgi:peptidoglycan/xylan/chitin deacetylase (PgdA/CDA1 family)